MRVVFAAVGREQLGLSMLSAVLRRHGFETALAFDPALFNDRYYFDVPGLRDVFDEQALAVESIIAAKPDLIAFSALTPTYQWCVEVARAVRKRIDVPVVIGGVHASAVPDVCLENECFDFVCRGEGEHAMLELCELLDSGTRRPTRPIPNLIWRGDDGTPVHGPNAAFIQDLDALPFFDKELWEDHMDVGAHYLTMSSRGRPYRCTFCFNNFFAHLPGKGGGKYVRQRSVEHQMNELHEANSRYGLKFVEFADDIFTVNKDWVRRFTQRYKREIGVPYQCLIHPRFIDDEMAYWLRDSGCVHVQMGVQSADEEYKRQVLLRMERDNHLHKALASLQRAGLPAKLDHILGLPGEPPKAQSLARDLYVQYPPKRIQTFWLCYFPGLEMTRQALEDGVLTQETVDAIERGASTVFRDLRLVRSDDVDEHFFIRNELLFRLLPLLPDKVRQKTYARHIPNVPPSVARRLALAMDIVNVVRTWDPEARGLVRHYAQTAMKSLPRRIRNKATTPRILPPIDTAWSLNEVHFPNARTLVPEPAPERKRLSLLQ